jgi:hypothetical protein
MQELDNLSVVLELAEIYKPEWPKISARIPDWCPRCEGDNGDGENDDDDNDDDKPKSGVPGDDASVEEWKAYARQWEGRAKKEPTSRKLSAERRAREKAEKELEDLRKGQQTDNEKAVTEAYEKGKTEAKRDSDSERRADRLESAAIRLATQGIKVKQGDKQVVLKFADADDAVTNVERMLRRGDIEEDDLFDDTGKVQTETLREALEELLTDKPHLVADSDDATRRAIRGRADQGRGSGDNGDSVDMNQLIRTRARGRR